MIVIIQKEDPSVFEVHAHVLSVWTADDGRLFLKYEDGQGQLEIRPGTATVMARSDSGAELYRFAFPYKPTVCLIHGYELRVGDIIQITGFYPDQEHTVTQINMRTQQITVECPVRTTGGLVHFTTISHINGKAVIE